MINKKKLQKEKVALPRGVHWTPVNDALDQLKKNIQAIRKIEKIATKRAVGRVLGTVVRALEDNPPFTNSAIDGFGFKGPTTNHKTQLHKISGFAAAGAPFDGSVPSGKTVKIFTGAILPPGVDTVLLEEDVDESDGDSITFRVPLGIGANTRSFGEDVRKGKKLFDIGHKIRPQDLAILIATGNSEVDVLQTLQVAIFSTGTELVELELPKKRKNNRLGQIYDSNRPMLSSIIKGWGFDVVDYGIIPDNAKWLKEKLNHAANRSDAIVISGGASAGDEDYVSKLIRSEGKLKSWRIAIKPGRPLILGSWDEVPIFGLPGNPVAAFVCSLIFVKPALGVLSGGKWTVPTGFLVPSKFEKKKKLGRREYLRAKLNKTGEVIIYKSEGSGKIYSLSWSTGLVELMEDQEDIKCGELVRFIPYSSFEIPMF